VPPTEPQDRRLEIKHNNTLCFVQSSWRQLEVGAQLAYFERLCSAPEFAWIRNVHLHIKALGISYKSILMLLFEFQTLRCLHAGRGHVSHASTHVGEVRLEVIQFASVLPHRGFNNQDIVLLKALRDVDVGALDPQRRRTCLSMRGKLRMERWMAPNLKIFASREEFNEETFRAQAKDVDFSKVKGGLER
jgi:hypothetical protein